MRAPGQYEHDGCAKPTRALIAAASGTANTSGVAVFDSPQARRRVRQDGARYVSTRHRPRVPLGRIHRAREAGARDRATMSERVFVEHEEADAFAEALLAAHGVPKKDAATVPRVCRRRSARRGDARAHPPSGLPRRLRRGSSTPSRSFFRNGSRPRRRRSTARTASDS